jgi:ribulose-phosphate 3-epimerase
MSVVVPALLAPTKEELDAQWLRVQPFASRVHIDAMDGQLAPNLNVTIPELQWSEGWVVDIHLMYQKPETQLKEILKLSPKPNLIIFHAESEGNLLQFAETLQQNGIKAGVALQRSTVPADVAGLISVVDHVLIFSGTLGEYGGTANMLQVEKIRLVKAINPEVEIGWDGGATVANAYTLALGGVDVVNVGATLANSANPTETFRQLDFEVHRKDVLEEERRKQKEREAATAAEEEA